MSDVEEMVVPKFVEEKQERREEVLNWEHLQELRRETSVYDEEDARAVCEVLCENWTMLYLEVLTEWAGRAKEDIIYFMDRGGEIFARNQRICGMGDKYED